MGALILVFGVESAASWGCASVRAVLRSRLGGLVGCGDRA